MSSICISCMLNGISWVPILQENFFWVVPANIAIITTSSNIGLLEIDLVIGTFRVHPEKTWTHALQNDNSMDSSIISSDLKSLH